MQDRKHDNLTSIEKELLEIARQKLIVSFKNRMSDPGSFETNIACLRKLKAGIEVIEQILTPHLEKKQEAENNVKTSYFDFFKNRARQEVLKETIIIEYIKDYLFNPPIPEMKESFSKEKRITGLFYSNSEAHRIQFSDGTILRLPSLEDNVIQYAKKIYVEKMEKLAPAKQLKI